MKRKHLLSLLQNDFTTIGVAFDTSSKLYTYKAKLAEGVKVGDTVVVDTPTHGVTLAEVMRVDATAKIDVDADFDYKWIVQKVNIEAYNAQVEADAKFQETLQEMDRIAEREKLLKQFKETYQDTPEALALLNHTLLGLGVTVDHE